MQDSSEQPFVLKPWAKDIDRRSLLKNIGVAGLVAAALPLISMRSAVAAPGFAQWRVDLHHAHTGERFSGVYRVGDKYLPEAFERLNYLMRDFRTGQVFPMDPHAVDVVSMVQRKTGSGKALEVLSGYRCPKTNAMLREASGGVARNSLHMYGQAVDIRMPDYSTARLRDVAKSLKAGGVGYYPKSDFVHVDTGHVRYW